MTELISVFSQTPWLFVTLSFIFAAVIGSFLNVVIHRMPVMMKREWQQECNHYLSEYKPDVFNKSKQQLEQPIDPFPEKYNLVVPGSACPKCKTNIKAIHNLPILGWLMLKGKCSACGTSISARYPIVELVTGCLIAFLAWHFGPTLEFALSSLLTFCLIALTGIDLDEMLLPDQITLPLLWLGLIINFNGVFTSLPDALIGAVAGYLSLWSVFWLFKLLTGKEGMGYGDFKLLAVFGAWLGWQVLPVIILLSSLVGAVVGITLIVVKKLNQGNPIPFGPYIAAAGWIAMIWGESIINWYISTL
ncbi:prepilin peptidase [Shewanella fidelis]|uniref:Prepilin leader peptidase/N-methyltransferase n=1 Tax=Shewanella fidelis TaxID=173509 RepID=A0AAW8NS58_9GAMM|nr:A24 family peptidase [Shewanella fidelis]MDR8525396.1 A24 family peptidase [Shewanella fidelis]MDW4813568.1 A24 family peptidase [Shewanella fidelis]MDW4817774.1 A24 family peptidase [Shewanella fidelis]MDW4821841.1 A24 family peptidase [Shewanella fidelis]MDW4825896.1 A24 family peptidase [Shewanella fidelis]